MNRSIIAFVCCLFAGSVQAHLSEQPRSFFQPRPLSAYTLINAGTMFTVPPHEQNTMSIEHTFFSIDSVSSSDNVEYFFGKGKSSLRVDETESGDINSQWFHLQSADGFDYKSKLYISPGRYVWGINLRMQQELGRLYEGLWAAVTVPFCQVKHSLRPYEVQDALTVVADGASFTNMLHVLDWDNWRAAKWSQKTQTITGVDDITLQVGITLSGPMNSTQRVYAEIGVPVGGRETGQYLFEPLTGSPGGLGLGGGTASVIPLFNVTDNLQLFLINQMQYRYHFSSRQLRTPDLKGQPFSRYYILLDTDLSPNITNVLMKGANGPNFLTREMNVAPGATGQSVTTLECRWRKHALSLGYAYWWRAAEQVSFVRASSRQFAVPSPKGMIGSVAAWLPSPRITDKWTADDASATVNAAPWYDIEFDMESVAAPHTASHTLYLQYTGRLSSVVGLFDVNVGGAYEIAENAAAFSTWQVWGGIGFTV